MYPEWPPEKLGIVIYAHDPSNRVVEKDRKAPEDHQDLLAASLGNAAKAACSSLSGKLVPKD